MRAGQGSEAAGVGARVHTAHVRAPFSEREARLAWFSLGLCGGVRLSQWPACSVR